MGADPYGDQSLQYGECVHDMICATIYDKHSAQDIQCDAINQHAVEQYAKEQHSGY